MPSGCTYMRRSHSTPGTAATARTTSARHVSSGQVAPVRGDVLADEHDLACAERHELFGLGDDVGQGHAHVGSADRGNRAVRARPVAAVGDAQVCRGALAVRVGAPGRARLAGTPVTRSRVASSVSSSATGRNAATSGSSAARSVGVARGHAACDDQRPALALGKPLGQPDRGRWRATLRWLPG